mgnify:FL=1
MYVDCMAQRATKLTTTVRLDAEDAKALARARADGLSTSELIRKGLRVVASRYYGRRRPPSTGLFVSTDTKLGDESELFRNIDD